MGTSRASQPATNPGRVASWPAAPQEEAMKVQDVMTRNVEACLPETDLAAAAMMMWRQDCGVIPVTNRDGRVAGVVTDRDICMAVATQHRLADQIHVNEIISGKVH